MGTVGSNMGANTRQAPSQSRAAMAATPGTDRLPNSQAEAISTSIVVTEPLGNAPVAPARVAMVTGTRTSSFGNRSRTSRADVHTAMANRLRVGAPSVVRTASRYAQTATATTRTSPNR